MPRKKDKNKYKAKYIIPSKYAEVREQLGLPIYSYTEEAPRTLELPRSEHPDISFFNDIDVNQWKAYNEIITDSLWLIGSRDKSGAHTAELHGNFIPQIPHQAMLRYTKRGEIVLDTFLGNGTTLIECKRLGRNGIGIELSPTLVERSRELIAEETNPWKVKTTVLEADSCLPETMQEVQSLLQKEYKSDKVQLIIMHPPYYDIIKFSDDPRDLCNAPTTEGFLERVGLVVKNSYELLERKRFLVLVIGDKYSRGEWVPLGFYTMQKVLENGYKLKSIVVKNIVGNRAKRNLDHFWRRRALKWGFYVFKHEYVMFFQKL
jgi:hypothetical protein